MRPEPRPEVFQLPAAVHGALDFGELKRLSLDPQVVLDFSVNSNPYGPSPMVWEAIKRVSLERYPDREALALRSALAEHLRISATQILVANGTAELLWLVGLAFLRSGDRIFIVDPTFCEYARVGILMGATITNWRSQAAQDFRIDPEAISQHLEQIQPRLVFLCNPNNPTGVVVPLAMITRWVQQYPQTLFIIDEAYAAFASDFCSALTLNADNVLVLRSMTKDYALAG
jgi:histidinol-phosphate/aromatic aminotransferase/cobyric acid decarboxylase-like protein